MRFDKRWAIGLTLIGLPLLALTTPAADDGFGYVGSKKCKICHLKEYKSWAETNMANAFDLLKPGARAEERVAAGLEADKDYTTDVACVKCHVTGYGQPGGFVSIEETPELAGVGCETCHGPGGIYIKPEHMSLKNKEYDKATLVAIGLVDTVGEQQCVSCHNGESPFVPDDHVFDFESKKDEGTHEKFPLKYKH